MSDPFGRSPAHTQISRALSFISQQKYEAAEVALREALQIDSENPVILNNLAYVLIQQQNPDKYSEAEQHLRRAAALQPQDNSKNRAAIYSNLGFVLLQGGDEKFEEAERHLQMSIEISDEADFPFSNPHFYLAQLFNTKGDWRTAFEYANAAWQKANNTVVASQMNDYMSELKREHRELRAEAA